MTKQVNVALSPHDEGVFFAWLRETADVQILLTRAPTDAECFVDYFVPDAFHAQFVIWNRAYPWEPSFGKVAAIHEEVRRRLEGMLAPSGSSFLRPQTGPFIHYSRGGSFSWDKSQIDSAYDIAGFEKWYASIVRWVRKHGRLLEGDPERRYYLPDAWERQAKMDAKAYDVSRPPGRIQVLGFRDAGPAGGPPKSAPLADRPVVRALPPPIDELLEWARSRGITIDTVRPPWTEEGPHSAPDLERRIPGDLTDPPLMISSCSASAWGDPDIKRALKDLGVPARDATVVTGMGRTKNALTAMLWVVPGVSAARLEAVFTKFALQAQTGTWSLREIAGKGSVHWCANRQWSVAAWVRDGSVMSVAGDAAVVEGAAARFL